MKSLMICTCHPVLFGVIETRRMIWAGHVAIMGKRRGLYRVLVGKPEGKRPLGRPKSRWENNINTDLQEVGRGVWNGLSWLSIGTDGGQL
jgi:hypothetical protein